jgi:hypothetical protein
LAKEENHQYQNAKQAETRLLASKDIVTEEVKSSPSRGISRKRKEEIVITKRQEKKSQL